MSPSEPEETYLTVAEVAETLKLNQQTVRNWIDQGSLPALRVGPARADQALGLRAHPGGELQRGGDAAQPEVQPERR